MAKISPLLVHKVGPTGEKFTATMPMTVNPKTGVFEVIIPRAVYDALAKMDLKGTTEYAAVHIGGNWPRDAKSADDEQVYSMTGYHLDTIKSRVFQAVDDMLATTVTEELVIRYVFNSTCHFWQNADGSIFTNGGVKGALGHDDRSLGDWAKSNTNSVDLQDSYTIGVGATVLVRQTHTNARGSSIKYVGISRSNDFTDRSAHHLAYRLDEFVKLRKDAKDAVEIPYTDEAAIFFFDLMMNLCRAAQRMNAFFSDRDAVALAIENKAAVYLLPKAGDL